jgi:hypothetical protein
VGAKFYYSGTCVKVYFFISKRGIFVHLNVGWDHVNRRVCYRHVVSRGTYLEFRQNSTSWTVKFSKPGMVKKCYILQNVQTSSAVTLPLFDGELDSFPGINRTLHSAEVKTEWSNTSVTLHLCLLGMVQSNRYSWLMYCDFHCPRSGEPSCVHPEFIFRC